MNYKGCFLCLGLLLLACGANAQLNTEGVTSFGQQDDSWRRTENEQKIQPLPQFVSTAGNQAMKTILEAEQAFCYEVFPQDPNFEGYSLDGFPIKGFCGVLDKEVRDVVIASFFANKEMVDFRNSKNCVIQPKMIVRFVRGVDYADVLFSSPCYSLSIFYGGKVSSYNYDPSGSVVDILINNLQERHQEFVSPALLNQLLPIGVAQTQEQRRMISKNREPIRKWEAKAEENVKKQEEELKRQSTGWNKLKPQF